MDGLVVSSRYRLTSSDPNPSGKSVFHVKLTDSALKILEEFHKKKTELSDRHPKIKFDGSSGEVVVPSTSGNRNFQFSLSSIVSDGSFECITEQRRDLSVVGSMSMKLNVLANDDVYKTTKEKMTLAEEQSKKNCAKEIKPSGPKVGRVVKKAIRSATLDHLQPISNVACLLSTAKINGCQQMSQNSLHGKQQPSLADKILVAAVSASGHVTNKTSSSSFSSIETTLCSDAVSQNSNSSSSSTMKPFSNSSSIVNYPYRDRIIHLLAVRPFKKIELQQKLERDGINEREKQPWTTVLKQVGVFNLRDNSYSLSRSCYEEVREDWPFYTDEARMEVKKRLSHYWEGTRSSSNSPELSPCPSIGSQSSPTDPQKHSTSNDVYSVPSKKQRIAHKGNWQDSTSPLPSQEMMTGIHSKTRCAVINDSVDKKRDFPPFPLESQENINSLSIPDPSLDYLQKYHEVQNIEQRRKYKAAFDGDFAEYHVLHCKLTERGHVFKALNDELKKANGYAYEMVKSKIFIEWDQLLKDEKYLKEKKRYNYLRNKLIHIKNLVTDYDARQLTSAAS